MSDQIVTNSDVPEETTVTPPVIGDKNQAIIDSAVKARLEREKASHKRALDAATSEQVRLTTELESANAIVEKYREIVEKLVEEKMKGLSQPVRDLLTKLEPLEQLDWLNANGAKLEEAPKKSVPPVPTGEAPKADPNAVIEQKKRFFHSV